MMEENSKKYKLLTNDQFIEAIKIDDMDTVINCTLPLVRSIADSFTKTTLDAKPHYRQDTTFEDYMGVGMEAVWNATKKYDATKKASFVTYAKIGVYNKCNTRFNQLMLGYEYTTVKVWRPQVDFNADFNEKNEFGDPNKHFAGLTVPIEEEERVDTDTMLYMINQIVSTEKRKSVLIRSFGIGCDPMTTEEIAKVDNKTHKNVNELKYRALKELKDNKKRFKQLLD